MTSVCYKTSWTSCTIIHTCDTLYLVRTIKLIKSKSTVRTVLIVIPVLFENEIYTWTKQDLPVVTEWSSNWLDRIHGMQYMYAPLHETHVHVYEYLEFSRRRKWTNNSWYLHCSASLCMHGKTNGNDVCCVPQLKYQSSLQWSKLNWRCFVSNCKL